MQRIMYGKPESSKFSESCFEVIVLKNSKRILRLSTSSPANGSERIRSFFPEIKARARRVRLISPVDIYFIPRSRIFSTPQSFTAGNASIFFAISGIGEPFFDWTCNSFSDKNSACSSNVNAAFDIFTFVEISFFFN